LDTVANLRSINDYEYKITFTKGGPHNGPETYYGSEREALVVQVRDQGVEDFTLLQTNLEDVYLKLTGRSESYDDAVR
jgi:hypothetical protein